MTTQLIVYNRRLESIALNPNLFTVSCSSTLNKRMNFLPFFSMLRFHDHFFCYNRSILNSIALKLREAYLSISKGFYLELLAVGVGYRFERLAKQNNMLVINVGYSHYIYYLLDPNVTFRCTKGYLFLFSNNLQLLKRTAIQIKQYKIPNVYTGKGIKYLKQELALKVGKKRK